MMRGILEETDLGWSTVIPNDQNGAFRWWFAPASTHPTVLDEDASYTLSRVLEST
jgi:hypothetical protein